MLKPVDVADELDVSVDTVLAWIRRGELPGVIVSADPRCRRPRYRIARDAVESFIEARTLPDRRVVRKIHRRTPYKQLV